MPVLTLGFLAWSSRNERTVGVPLLSVRWSTNQPMIRYLWNVILGYGLGVVGGIWNRIYKKKIFLQRNGTWSGLCVEPTKIYNYQYDAPSCYLFNRIKYEMIYAFRSSGSVVGIVTTLPAGRSGVRILAVQGIFLFSKTCIPALGPTNPPLQWMPASFPGSKAAGA
jgi:hypothetical protein